MTKKTFWGALLALILIPLFGYFSSILITKNVDNTMRKGGWEYSLTQICQVAPSLTSSLTEPKAAEQLRSILSLCEQV